MRRQSLFLAIVALFAACLFLLVVGVVYTSAGDVQGTDAAVASDHDVGSVRQRTSASSLEWGRAGAITITPVSTVYIPLALRNYSPGAIGFGYGVEASSVGDTITNVGHVQTMGLDWVKLEMSWKVVEPAQGTYDWGTWDNLVNAYDIAGIKILLSISSAPAWARAGQDPSVDGPPNNPNDLADFLGVVVGRYCNTSVSAIEVWEEQNLHYEWGNLPIDPAAYMALLKPAYNRVKAMCPDKIVVSGAPVPTGAPPPLAMDDYQYLEGMYEAGLADYSDAIGAHPGCFNVAPWVESAQEACDFILQQNSTYRGPCNTLHHAWYFLGTMQGYHNIMGAYADEDKKIVVTEFGWAVSDDPEPAYQFAYDNTYAEQAEWTVWAFQWGKATDWAGPMMLFNLDYGLVAAGLPISYWSLLTPTGTVPAYTAIAEMPKTR